MIETTRKLFDQLGIHIDPEARVDSLSVAYMQFVEIAKAVSRNRACFDYGRAHGDTDQCGSRNSV